MNLQEKRVLNSLKPIIKEWKIIIKKYSNENENEDALYWYNERATLSTFAGAIWLSGGTVLEEFSATKIKSKKKKYGRTDLWFDWHRKEYIVEAKQVSSTFEPRKTTVVDKMEKFLEKACEDAKIFSPPKDHQNPLRIGITFLTPYLSESKDKPGIMKSKISDLKKRLSRKYGRRLLAWIFPPSTWKLKDTKDRLIYPGVALVAKVVRKKTDKKK